MDPRNSTNPSTINMKKIIPRHMMMIKLFKSSDKKRCQGGSVG